MLVEVTKNATAVSAAMTTATTAAMTVRDMMAPGAIILGLSRACQRCGSLRSDEPRGELADLHLVLRRDALRLEIADRMADAMSQRERERDFVVDDEQRARRALAVRALVERARAILRQSHG